MRAEFPPRDDSAAPERYGGQPAGAREPGAGEDAELGATGGNSDVGRNRTGTQRSKRAMESVRETSSGTPAPDVSLRDGDGAAQPVPAPSEMTLEPVREDFAPFAARRFFAAVAVAATLHVGLRAALLGLAAELDEPLVLRWLRTVDDHPVRCTLATSLAVWALGLGRGAPHDADGSPAESRSASTL